MAKEAYRVSGYERDDGSYVLTFRHQLTGGQALGNIFGLLLVAAAAIIPIKIIPLLLGLNIPELTFAAIGSAVVPAACCLFYPVGDAGTDTGLAGGVSVALLFFLSCLIQTFILPTPAMYADFSIFNLLAMTLVCLLAVIGPALLVFLYGWIAGSLSLFVAERLHRKYHRTRAFFRLIESILLVALAAAVGGAVYYTFARIGRFADELKPMVDDLTAKGYSGIEATEYIQAHTQLYDQTMEYLSYRNMAVMGALYYVYILVMKLISHISMKHSL